MQELAQRNYFTDHEILQDPYAYFEAVREKGPLHRLDNGIVVVTGYEEILSVLNDRENFSSVLAPQGPAAPLPFKPEGEDIYEQIEAHRTDFVGGDLLVSLDGQPHARSRALLMKLFTPSRLRQNEDYIRDLASRMVGEAVVKGECDLINEIATPFVTLVIADLLGVPADDRQLFMDAIEAGPPPGSLDSDDLVSQNQPLVIMGGYFVEYVADRRANPRNDVLSELSNATYADGTVPEALEIVRLATFLFGAGQDTSAKLLGNAMRILVEDADLQDSLRADPSQIPAMLEEVLRLEGSTKMTARLVRKDTAIGDLQVSAGTTVMLALAAGNRDPRRWDDPTAFRLNRPKIREHLAFGRGAHVCAGAPLARVEVRIIMEKLLEATKWIELDEDHHGPVDDRKLEYDASFIIRGLTGLHLKLIAADDFVAPEQETAAESAPAKKRRGLFGFGGEGKSAADDGYSTASTRLGVLLADPEAKAVLDRHFPGVSTDPRIGMGKGMTLRSIQKFAPDMFTEEAMNAVDADLDKLQPGGST